jgi:hypothetical protein
MPPQQKRVRNGFKDVDSAWIHLNNVSRTLKYSQRLTKGQSNRFKRVSRNRIEEGLSAAAIKHHTFLNRVLDIDSSYHTLCTIAFTQNQIESTRTTVLDELVERIQQRQGDPPVVSSSIRSLTADLENRGTVQPPQDPSQRLANASEKWFVFMHARLEGTRELLGEDMVHKIKSSHLGNDWRAVTMHFPSWPTPDNLDSCFMRLDIREEEVEGLAMALFSVKVEWVLGVLQIAYDNGMVQLIPHPEFTLKGVLEQDIVTVFKSEIHGAITECPIRVRERAEGKHRTECVSMAFSRKECTITLTMGLDRGIEIQNKLN